MEELSIQPLVWQEKYNEAIDLLRKHKQLISKECTCEAFLDLCRDTTVEDEDETLELIKYMLQLNPDLTKYRDEYCGDCDNKIALHLAVVEDTTQEVGDGVMIELVRTGIPRSTALALLLIEVFPDGVNVQDDFGYTPFQVACQACAEFAVLKAMLEVNPNLADQAFRHSTPLSFLWVKKRFIIDESIMLILLTALKGRVMDPLPTEHLLHAACNYRCPPYFYSKLWETEDITAQLTRRDDRGNLPLHYALRASYLQGQDVNQGNTPRYQRESTALISSLLEFSPEMASMVDGEGRLPLFIALGNRGTSWVRESILRIAEAYPHALNRRDSEHKLFPALLAATRAHENTEHLSVTYELLLKTPEMLLHALESNVGVHNEM